MTKAQPFGAACRMDAILRDMASLPLSVDIPIEIGGVSSFVSIPMMSDDPHLVYESICDDPETRIILANTIHPDERKGFRQRRGRQSGPVPTVRLHLLVPREYYGLPWWDDPAWWAEAEWVAGGIA